MTELDSEALTERLAEMIRSLDAHIERRAQEIAAPRMQSALDASNRFIAEGKEAIEFERQRNADVEAELRKWIARRDRQIDGQATLIQELKAENTALRELRKRVVQNLVTCATGPDGVRYAPYGALAAAVWPEKKTEDPQ